jgi:hypothetical protein
MEEETFNLMTTTHDGSHAAIPPNFLDTGVGIDDEDQEKDPYLSGQVTKAAKKKRKE